MDYPPNYPWIILSVRIPSRHGRHEGSGGFGASPPVEAGNFNYEIHLITVEFLGIRYGLD